MRIRIMPVIGLTILALSAVGCPHAFLPMACACACKACVPAKAGGWMLKLVGGAGISKALRGSIEAKLQLLFDAIIAAGTGLEIYEFVVKPESNSIVIIVNGVEKGTQDLTPDELEALKKIEKAEVRNEEGKRIEIDVRVN